MHDIHLVKVWTFPLIWRHNGHDSISNHQPQDCLFKRLFRCRSKKTSKLRVTGVCAGNSPGTGEFPAQMANDAENVSIWWRHHVPCLCLSWHCISTTCSISVLSCHFDKFYCWHCLNFKWNGDIFVIAMHMKCMSLIVCLDSERMASVSSCICDVWFNS